MDHAGLVSFVNVSLVMLIIGATTTLFIVQRELGPASRLSSGGKWLLTAALGSGIIAFSIKLAIIALLSSYPRQIIAPQIASPASLAWQDDIPPVRPAMRKAAALSRQYVWEALPAQTPAPAWNPTAPDKVALGKLLFHDPALSRDGSVSCSSCHDVEQGAGIDGRPTSVGIDGQVGGRNAPTVWNAAFQSVLFWDGRAHTLEEQALGPLLNPIEMGMPTQQDVVRRVSLNPDYRQRFASVFGADKAISIEHIAAAIAAYERTLITPDTPYDRFVRGDRNALDQAQLRGMALFQSNGCVLCHSGANFSNASLLGTVPMPFRIFPIMKLPSFAARYQLTRDGGLNPPDGKHGVWRIPSLRNVALTAPYFHNGAVRDLKEAVRIMATAQRGRVISDKPDVRRIVWSPERRTMVSETPPTLSEHDLDDIVAFLQALSSDALVARQVGAH